MSMTKPGKAILATAVTLTFVILVANRRHRNMRNYGDRFPHESPTEPRKGFDVLLGLCGVRP